MSQLLVFIKYMLLKTVDAAIKTLDFQVKGGIFRFPIY